MERPEDGRAGRVAAKELQWEGPRFDPSKPEGFEPFIKAHRAWLVKLLEAQFGRKIE